MDYVEAASALGQAIAESNEFISWKDAEGMVMTDVKAQKLLKEYRELQSDLVKGSRQDLSKEDLLMIRDTLAAKQCELNEYPITKAYLEGKKGFETMMATVNDVIQHYLDNGSCTGSCETCGGCQ